jgi:hypothetical protein
LRAEIGAAPYLWKRRGAAEARVERILTNAEQEGGWLRESDMRRFAAAMMAVLLAMAGLPAHAQAGPAVSLEGKVAQVAATMAGVTPMALPGGLALEAVVAQGRAIVLKFSGVPAWRPQVDDRLAASLLGAQLCEGAQVRALIAEGAEVRIEGTTPGGEALPPLPICRERASDGSA